jgi:hypothetical protein
MPVRYLHPKRFVDPSVPADANADWYGDNAAFTCPVCSKVFIVSSFISKSRNCPACRKSTGFVSGKCETEGSEAKIEWDND